MVGAADSPVCARGLVSTVFVVSSEASSAVKISPSPVVIENRGRAKP